MTDSPSRDSGDIVLLRYLGEAAAVVPWPEPATHPDADTLVRYLEGELPEADAQALRLHLFRCGRCFAVVSRLEQVPWVDRLPSDVERRGVGRPLVFSLKRLWPLVPEPAGEQGLALAAASEAQVRPASEIQMAGSIAVGLAVTSSGDLVAMVGDETAGGRPVKGAWVVLEERTPGQRFTVCAEAETDEAGEASLGPARRFAAGPGGPQFRVRVELPPEGSGASGSEP